MTALFILQVGAFLWIGFVGAISFMEAWIKFRAPGVTAAIGLGIGKLVFGALNKVEWFLALVISACLLLSMETVPAFVFFLLSGLLLILSAQTFWLLPHLNARADALIKGQSLRPSSLHWFYVGAEVLKVVLLFMLGITAFKTAGMI